MANEYLVNKADLDSVADKINEILGVTDALVFPSGFISALNQIKSLANGQGIPFLDPVIIYTGNDDGEDMVTHYFTIRNNNSFDVVCTYSGGSYDYGDTVTILANSSKDVDISDGGNNPDFEAQFMLGNVASNLISGNAWDFIVTYSLSITAGLNSFAHVGSGATFVDNVATFTIGDAISQTAYTGDISSGETITVPVFAKQKSDWSYLALSATCTNATYTFTKNADSDHDYTLTISNPTGDVTVTINGNT